MGSCGVIVYCTCKPVLAPQINGAPPIGPAPVCLEAFFSNELAQS